MRRASPRKGVSPRILPKSIYAKEGDLFEIVRIDRAVAVRVDPRVAVHMSWRRVAKWRLNFSPRRSF